MDLASKIRDYEKEYEELDVKDRDVNEQERWYKLGVMLGYIYVCNMGEECENCGSWEDNRKGIEICT